MNDSISRQAAIKAIDDLPNCYNGFSDRYDKACIIGVLEELPTAQPERKKGTWIHQTKFGRIECDQCGKVYRNAFTQKNFCPNCGSDMREKE